MTLYIIRHAWAYQHGDPRWPDDSKRPLEKDGAKRFSRVVKRLLRRGFAPEKIATSPYLRCKQTADIVAEYSPTEPQVVELDALKPGSDLDALIEWSQQFAEQSLAWVGHAPDVTRLASALVGDDDANIRFSKGAVAAISFDDSFEPSAGELAWLATAKLLGV